jgi:hypothetical protein
LGDLGIGGRITLKLILKKQGKNQWQILMNMVMNLWVPYKARNFLIT